jgi:hypothetical protein
MAWEPNSKGGWEAWHVPPGAVRRKDRTYLGYVNLQTLAEWENLTPDELAETVENWIQSKRAKKGINQ